MMKIFELSRNQFHYDITINGHKVANAFYISETKAIEWAENFISSWDSSMLQINFKRMRRK